MVLETVVSKEPRRPDTKPGRRTSTSLFNRSPTAHGIVYYVKLIVSFNRDYHHNESIFIYELKEEEEADS